MKLYHVYFEIYNKKIKASLYAISKVQAENIVRSKLKIHKIEDTGIDKGSVADMLNLKESIEDIMQGLNET